MKDCISFTQEGSFKKTELYLNACNNLFSEGDIYKVLSPYAEAGVNALKEYTPVDTGRLQDSWGYEISYDKNGCTITWTNNDIEGGASVALLVQYGHGTKSGTYVEGVDYINPALSPIFDKMAKRIWKEVKGSND